MQDLLGPGIGSFPRSWLYSSQKVVVPAWVVTSNGIRVETIRSYVFQFLGREDQSVTISAGWIILKCESIAAGQQESQNITILNLREMKNSRQSLRRCIMNFLADILAPYNSGSQENSFSHKTGNLSSHLPVKSFIRISTVPTPEL